MYSGKDTFTGYRHPCSGELDGTDDISIWWSASSQDGDNARNVCLERGTQGAELDWFNCDFAFPLRLLSEA